MAKFFADGHEDLVFLEDITRDVGRKVLRVNGTSVEPEVLQKEIHEAVHDRRRSGYGRA